MLEVIAEIQLSDGQVQAANIGLADNRNFEPGKMTSISTCGWYNNGNVGSTDSCSLVLVTVIF